MGAAFQQVQVLQSALGEVDQYYALAHALLEQPPAELGLAQMTKTAYLSIKGLPSPLGQPCSGLVEVLEEMCFSVRPTRGLLSLVGQCVAVLLEEIDRTMEVYHQGLSLATASIDHERGICSPGNNNKAQLYKTYVSTEPTYKAYVSSAVELPRVSEASASTFDSAEFMRDIRQAADIDLPPVGNPILEQLQSRGEQRKAQTGQPVYHYMGGAGFHSPALGVGQLAYLQQTSRPQSRTASDRPEQSARSVPRLPTGKPVTPSQTVMNQGGMLFPPVRTTPNASRPSSRGSPVASRRGSTNVGSRRGSTTIGSTLSRRSSSISKKTNSSPGSRRNSRSSVNPTSFEAFNNKDRQDDCEGLARDIMDEGLWQTVMSEDGESNTQNNKGTRSRQNSRGVSLSPIERSKSSIVRFEDENDQLDSDKHHTPSTAPDVLSLTLAQQQQARLKVSSTNTDSSKWAEWLPSIGNR